MKKTTVEERFDEKFVQVDDLWLGSAIMKDGVGKAWSATREQFLGHIQDERTRVIEGCREIVNITDREERRQAFNKLTKNK